MENQYLNTANILYVEDEVDIRDGYSRTLKKCAKELYIASNGKEGLAQFNNHPIDIVVSDIKMPMMDGIEMVSHILEISPNTAVIFTTAHSEPNILLEAIEFQVDGYLLKPVPIKKLMALINKVSKNILLEKQNKEYQIKIQKQNEMLKHKVNVDGLTGIYNRNMFEELLTYELKKKERNNEALSIALIDIDLFKKFNDKFGHLIGDEVLIMLADGVSNAIRASDTFARWGGEEFVLIFPNTNLEGAVEISNILRKKIEALKHESAGKVTVSIGVSEVQQGDTLESIFERCDQALYLAKNDGRNNVKFL